MFQTSESCIKLHAVVVLELLLSEQWPLLQVCVCPLLQVCVHLDGSNAENKISQLGYTLYNYVCKKNKTKTISKPIFFFYITDYGKMLKYREKYR